MAISFDVEAELRVDLGKGASRRLRRRGRISHAMTDLEVACQAKDLPEYIEVDLAELDKGQSLHISDLSLPAGVQSVVLAQGAEHDRDIVTVHGQGGAAAAEEETEQPAD